MKKKQKTYDQTFAGPASQEMSVDVNNAGRSCSRMTEVITVKLAMLRINKAPSFWAQRILSGEMIGIGSMNRIQSEAMFETAIAMYRTAASRQ